MFMTDWVQVRDEFEAKLPKWRQQLSSYVGIDSPYEIDVNILQLYSYAKEDEQKLSFGILLAHYLANFVEAIEVHTRNGSDLDAQNLIRKAVHKNKVTVRANEGYFGIIKLMIRVEDGCFVILFKPKAFGHLGEIIYPKNVGIAVDLGELRLSLHSVNIMRRAFREDLEPKLDEYKTALRDIFQKDVAISYDLRKLKTIMSSCWYPKKFLNIFSPPFVN